MTIVQAGCSVTVGYSDPKVTRQSAAKVGVDVCSPQPPLAASEAARAYVRAIAAATPAWRNLDATLTAEGFRTHHDDLLAQVKADAPFLTALRVIKFPPRAQPAARDLISAIQAYDDFLTTAYAQTGYLARHMVEDKRLNVSRARSSARLRQALSLPPSTCTYNRP